MLFMAIESNASHAGGMLCPQLPAGLQQTLLQGSMVVKTKGLLPHGTGMKNLDVSPFSRMGSHHAAGPQNARCLFICNCCRAYGAVISKSCLSDPALM